MLNIPDFGAHVRVWPMPGRRVQLDARAVDQWGGGRFLPAKGAMVVWSLFHLEALRSGDLLLHAPPCDEHDFGAQADNGKFQHDECLFCGRDQAAAQQYDVDFEKGVTLCAADSAARAAGHVDAAAMEAAQKSAEAKTAPREPAKAPVADPPAAPVAPTVETKE
jgi:hypothetical protein